MALPQMLKNYLLFVDGFGYAGVVTTFNPPVLNRQMEEHRAGGMIGPVQIDLGMQAMEASFVARGFATELMKNFARPTVGALALRLACAAQRDDTGQVESIQIYMRGRVSGLDRGGLTVGEANETTHTIAVSYYKEVVNGVTIIEIDPVNMIEYVNGQDMQAAIRLALGLASIV